MRYLLASTASLLLAISASHQPARAQRVQSFSLNWVRDANAEDCIDSHRLAAFVERMLGPVFVLPGNAELAIEGRVFRAEQWRARIAVSDRNGKVLGARQLSSSADSCRTLDPQIVLVVAMAIDPEVADAGLPSELLAELEKTGDSAEALLAELKAQPSPAPALPAPAPVAEPKPMAAQRRPPGQPQPAHEPPSQLHDFRVAVLADFALGLGMLPELGSAPGVGVAVQPLSPWTVALSLQWWLPNSAQMTAPGTADVNVTFHQLQGTLAACLAALRTSALRWSGCLGITGAMRWTDSNGLLMAQNEARTDFGPTVATELWFGPTGPIAGRLGAAVSMPLRRARYLYRDGVSSQDRELFEASAVAIWAYLGGALLL